MRISDINAVSVSGGPGSYTGLRVGVSTAKGICYSQDIPLIAVDSLAGIAIHAAEKYSCDFVIPMIDARRMEVYTALFDGGGNRKSENHAQILSEHIYDHLLEREQTIIICGDGTQKAKTMFEHERIICDETITHSALHLLKPALSAYMNGKFVDVFQYAPGYLKPPNITKPKKSMI